MKKLFLAIALVLFSFSVFSQVIPQKRMITVVADTSVKLNQSMLVGDWVYVQSTKNTYVLNTNIWKASTYSMGWVLASSSRYYIPGTTTFTGITLTTTGNATIGGTLTVIGATTHTGKVTIPYLAGTHQLFVNDSATNVVASTLVKSPTFTATGAITTSGSGYFGYGSTWLQDSSSYFPSRTSGSSTWLAWYLRQAGTPKCRISLQNMANYSIQDKASTGQVLVLQRDTTGSTAKVNLAAIKDVNISGDITGSTLTRGNAFFGEALTRAAVFIAGATSSDYYIVSGIAVNSHTRPVAGDFMNCFAVTDSLIVMRQAGTTANLGFSFFRIK